MTKIDVQMLVTDFYTMVTDVYNGYANNGCQRRQLTQQSDYNLILTLGQSFTLFYTLQFMC